MTANLHDSHMGMAEVSTANTHVLASCLRAAQGFFANSSLRYKMAAFSFIDRIFYSILYLIYLIPRSAGIFLHL